MVNNYQLFNSSYTTLSSDDDFLDQNHPDFEIPMPELWNTGNVALPVIDEISESFSKRNANDDHEASISSSKKVRVVTPLPEPVEQEPFPITLDIREEAKQSSRRTRRIIQADRANIFTEAENKRIIQGKEANEPFTKIAEALNMSVGKIKYQWYNHLSKDHPELAKTKKPIEPILSLFTPGEEETLLDGIKKRLSWGQIAKILKRPAKEIKYHWDYDLSKNHPGVEYDPVDPKSTTLFNDEIDKKIADLINTGFTYDAVGKELGYEGHQIRHRWNGPLRGKFPDVIYTHTHLRTNFNIPQPAPIQQPLLLIPAIPPHLHYNMQVQQAAYFNGGIPPFPFTYWKPNN